jgi:hypothetical protein
LYCVDSVVRVARATKRVSANRGTYPRLASVRHVLAARHAGWLDSANLKKDSTGGYHDAPARPAGSALP